MPEAVKAERLARLQALLERSSRPSIADRRAHLDVLFEKPGRHPGQMAGRSPYLQPVQFDERQPPDR